MCETGLFESIFQTVREPLIVLDCRLTVVMANQSFYQTFWLSPGEAEGRGFLELADGFWNLPELAAMLREVVPERKQIQDFDVECQSMERGRKFLSLNARRVVREPGVPQLILLAMEDITERRLQELKIEVLNEELRRSNRDLEEFARTASHDLQEPLRKIRAFADRLQSEDGGALSAQGGLYMEKIMSSAGRMQRLIGSLLALARACNEPIDAAETDLNAVVGEVLDDMEETMAAAEAEVLVSGLPALRSDPVQMKLLFQNLISNAIKFRRAGEKPVIRISARKQSEVRGGPIQEGRAGENTSQFWEIAVKDNGIGFEERHSEKIFGVFQRLHAKDKYEGSGLGLAICRKIAGRHGGSIDARSVPGIGSTFLIQLPAGIVKASAAAGGGAR